MKSKYTKQYLFRKQNENVALLSDEISFGVIDTSYQTRCELWLE